MFRRIVMYPVSILLVVLLASLGRCDKKSVFDDKQILDDIYLNQSTTFEIEDACERISGDIEDCVYCYPCEHESIKGKPNVERIKVRTSAEVCSTDAYLIVCCVPAEPRITVTARNSSQGTCGKRNIQLTTQEVSSDGLQNTGFGEFPWVVAILSKCSKDYYFRCVGTLLNGRTVLTTAHCVTSMRKMCSLRVRAGEWQFSSDTKSYIEADVDDVIVHEDYNTVTFYNNIALLILRDQITPETNIGFVCLDDYSAPSEGSECYVAGWGVPVSSKDRHRDTMRLIKMKHLERDECERSLNNSTLGEDFKLDGSCRCAVGENGETITKGDGGAALICSLKGVDNRFVQYGIASLNQTFHSRNVPSVFTDVNLFKSWIEEKVDEIFKNDATLIKDPYSI